MSTAAHSAPTTTSAPVATAPGAPAAPFGPLLRFELTKLLAPWRTRILLALCLLGPAAFVAAVSTQQALPADTVFGRWMMQSGWAAALVLLAFCCQWVLPLAAAVLAGDVFASEDRLGTWRHLVQAVRSPRRIFAAKALASLLGVLLVVACLAASSIASGLAVAGNRTLVGLDGQPIAPSRAAVLVLLAWALAAVGTLAWAGLGLLGSVLFGRSPAALLVPPVVALALQMAQMLPLPVGVRLALPSEAFVAWRGLFTQAPQTRTVLAALAVSLAWAAVCVAAARWAFVRRDFTDLANDGNARRALALGLAPLAVLTAASVALMTAWAGTGQGVTKQGVERNLATSFAHLYRLQAHQLGRPDVTEDQLATSAACDRGGELVADAGPGNDWRCVVTWHLPGARATGQAIYQLDVAPDGRVVADGDGPTEVNGYFVVPTPAGPAANPTWQVDGLVDLLPPQ